MTVVVTGASGFVGGHLVRALLDQGRQVRTPIHQEEERQWLDGLDIEIVEGDVRDLDSLRRAFAGADVVYHLAGYISLLMSDWPLVEAINVNGVRNVVEACLEADVRRLVHFSSFHAHTQQPLDEPLDETRTLVAPGESSPYDCSKAAGEREVRKGIARGLDAITLNPTGIIGPHDCRPSYFGQAILDMGRGKIPALVAGGCDWVDVRDVVEGAMRAEERADSGAKYLLSGHWVSLRDLADLVAEITGVPAPRLVLPMRLARLAAPFTTAFDRLTARRPRFTQVTLNELSGNHHISHERAARDLDYQPRPFRESIQDIFDWLVESRRLELLVGA